MRLIEAEKAKDAIHEYFKSLMVNGASGTDVDRLAVGIGSCLKHDANLLKAIDELPSAEQDTTTHDSIPAETGKNDGVETSGDCISRQVAIDALLGITAMRNTIPLDSAIFNIKKLPSIQPERKTGHWIKTARWGRVYYCDQCRNYLDFDGVNAGRGSTNFCPNCGADMRGEKE